MDDERRDFLPPEPAGPEPELGPGPTPPQAPPAPQAPPPGYPTPQQQYPPPPPGYAPYGWQQQQAPPPGWGYGPPQAQPDNGPAVTGFVLSLVSAALLFLSGGISSLISVGCSIAGIVLSRKGKQKVERGETQKNQGLAQAGFIIGIIGLVLAVLATLVWGAVLVAVITSEEFRRDFENELDNSDSITAALQVVATGVRLLLG